MDPLTIASLGLGLLGKQRQSEEQQIPLVPTSGQGASAIQRRMQSQEESPLGTLQQGLSALSTIKGLSADDKAKAANLLGEAQSQVAPQVFAPEPAVQLPAARRQFYG